MYTLDIKKRVFHNIIVWTIVSIVSFAFARIYNIFGHGVTSFYMNFMFLWPLICLVIYIVLAVVKSAPNRFSENILNAGTATFTVGSMIRGIFEIAGTSSDYEMYFFILGGVLAVTGVVTALCFPVKCNERVS